MNKSDSSCRLRRFYALSLLFFTLISSSAWSQEEHWTGRWEAHYQPWPHIAPIIMSLHIAEPEQEMLYPASLELTHGSFSGKYKMLLVKKNDKQLGLGRNKYPIEETPFGLGPWMMYLNGVLDYSESTDSIRLQRVWLDNPAIFMKGLYDNEFYTNTKAYIREFLYHSDIRMAKVDKNPWKHPDTEKIIHSDSIYYGVYDPVETDQNWLTFFLQDEERYDRDTITVVHNGKVLADRLPVDHAMDLDSISLDVGQNYIAFFADNYGDIPPNTASFITGTSGKNVQQYIYDFRDHSNAFATVMVGNFIYSPKEEEMPMAMVKPKLKTLDTGIVPADERTDISIGSWSVKSDKVLLELWDGRIEDGDTISLSVNDRLIADNLMVTKKIKKIWISLRPGTNRIVFIAENLGRIPPNTAIMQVTAGGRKRRFFLNTSFEHNNVLEITLPN